jgi:hypothetical protein
MDVGVADGSKVGVFEEVGVCVGEAVFVGARVDVNTGEDVPVGESITCACGADVTVGIRVAVGVVFDIVQANEINTKSAKNMKIRGFNNISMEPSQKDWLWKLYHL